MIDNIDIVWLEGFELLDMAGIHGLGERNLLFGALHKKDPTVESRKETLPGRFAQHGRAVDGLPEKLDSGEPSDASQGIAL